MQFAPAGDLEGIGAVRVLHPQGHVVLQLLHEPLPDAPALGVLAVLAGEGAVVDHEHHRDGGLVDIHVRQGLGVVRGRRWSRPPGCPGCPPGPTISPGGGLGEVDPGQPLEAVEHGHPVVLHGAVALHQGHLLAHLDLAVDDPADADLAHEIVVVHEGHQHLQGGLGVALGGRAAADDGVEQGVHGLGLVVHVHHGVAQLGAGEHAREVQLLLAGPQLDEQVEHRVLGPQGPGARAVHFVDHHDGPQAQGQGLAGDELGLGHGAVEGVHHQEHRVHHAQHPFHLAAEVRVAGGVHDVEPVAAPVQGRGLGQDGDATLPFLVVAVHGPFLHPLVVPEHVGALEHGVHQRGLAVIHVGDDGDVADLLDGCHAGPWKTRGSGAAVGRTLDFNRRP